MQLEQVVVWGGVLGMHKEGMITRMNMVLQGMNNENSLLNTKIHEKKVASRVIGMVIGDVEPLVCPLRLEDRAYM